ncbi:MAG: cupredoxin domain-containing protein [Candidatus Limnocylindria bacterium]
MARSRPLALVAVLTILVLVLAACSSSDITPSAAGGGDDAGGDTGETVSLSGGAFSPSTLTIPVGTTVTFTDGASHTVTEGSDGTAVDDPIVDATWAGDPIEVTFDEAGTYDITCRIHPNMNMTITVEG